MSKFRRVDRATGFLLPPSVDEWLADRHPAGFVVEVIEPFDLSSMVKAYRGSGSASYRPSVLPGLAVYGYATGVFSSRKPERATYDSVACRFIAANDHPGHDTIAAFRRRFPDRIEGLFVPVPAPAREAGMPKLGPAAPDGAKAHANASRHGALSYGHACKIEARLKAEAAELMALAEAADAADVPDGMPVPEESARRADRLARIAEAKATIEARAKERHERGQAEYAERMKARAEKAKHRQEAGRASPQPPAAGPGPKDQVDLTDEDSRIMPVAGGGCFSEASAVIFPGSSALPHHRRARTTRQLRKRCCIVRQRPKAGRPTLCASRPRNRCSPSSNRSWASGNSTCEASIRQKESGTRSPWPET